MDDGPSSGLDGWESAIDGGHPNLRWLGGRAEDGRRVRRGAFLRGPALHDRPEEFWLALPELDRGLIVDFRRADEVEARPIRLPAALRERARALPINSGATSDGSVLGHGSDGRQTMISIYRGFVRSHLGTYATFLEQVARTSDGAVFFHCTAGKDRTGVAAALILLALGVPRDQVMADFLATGSLWSPDAALLEHVAEEARAAVFGVDPAYLEAALDELDREQGGARAFAARAMGGEAVLRAWTDRSLV